MYFYFVRILSDQTLPDQHLGTWNFRPCLDHQSFSCSHNFAHDEPFVLVSKLRNIHGRRLYLWEDTSPKDYRFLARRPRHETGHLGIVEISNDSNGKKITERTSVTFSKWTFVIRASHSFTLPGQNAGVTKPRDLWNLFISLASRLLNDDWVQIL